MVTKTPTLERTEELVHMHIDCFNDRKLEEAERNVSPDFEATNVGFDRKFRGPKGYLESNRLWLDAFPDGKCEVTRVVSQGNVAVLEFRGKGTHRGELEGPRGTIAPTGNKVDMPFVSVYEFKNDKLHRARTYFDTGTMMRQLGIK